MSFDINTVRPIDASITNPSKPGVYNVSFDGVLTIAPIFLNWDGEQWGNSFLSSLEKKMYWYPNKEV